MVDEHNARRQKILDRIPWQPSLHEETGGGRKRYAKIVALVQRVGPEDVRMTAVIGRRVRRGEAGLGISTARPTAC